MSDKVSSVEKPGLREVLLSAGLDDQYLERIESEPGLAKEVANSIRQVLERKPVGEKTSEKKPCKQASPTGSDMPPHFW
jgi:hypothetical protein